MRRLLESRRSFLPLSGAGRDRWHGPRSGDASAKRIAPYDGTGNFKSNKPPPSPISLVQDNSCRPTCLAKCTVDLLSVLCLPGWCRNVWVRGCGGAGRKESARAKAGQILLLHKPRTNEGEDRARQCYVIKFRSGGRSWPMVAYV